jgi:hypothetical protein
VRLDAARPETYADVHGVDAFARVQEGVERLAALQREIGLRAPLIALEFVSRLETQGELGEWWSRWSGKVDWPFLRGYDAFAGQVRRL